MMARPTGARTQNGKVTSRQKAWQSMRILRRFTLPDLVATAEIGRENIKTYLARLERAGIIRKVLPRRSGVKGGHAVYALIRNSGPHAPRANSAAVYDPNSGEEIRI